ncbi:hypothetical protein J7L85_02765 [candidate division WOR-3 bacterium]|nr:hypothetical protein [candidate division WOR-3 bacterium]
MKKPATSKNRGDRKEKMGNRKEVRKRQKSEVRGQEETEVGSQRSKQGLMIVD